MKYKNKQKQYLLHSKQVAKSPTFPSTLLHLQLCFPSQNRTAAIHITDHAHGEPLTEHLEPVTVALGRDPQRAGDVLGAELGMRQHTERHTVPAADIARQRANVFRRDGGRRRQQRHRAGVQIARQTHEQPLGEHEPGPAGTFAGPPEQTADVLVAVLRVDHRSQHYAPAHVGREWVSVTLLPAGALISRHAGNLVQIEDRIGRAGFLGGHLLVAADVLVATARMLQNTDQQAFAGVYVGVFLGVAAVVFTRVSTVRRWGYWWRWTTASATTSTATTTTTTTSSSTRTTERFLNVHMLTDCHHGTGQHCYGYNYGKCLHRCSWKFVHCLSNKNQTLLKVSKMGMIHGKQR
uniref:Uncharacterized protein n=1 Tax=Anopheles quadriannulatus TaxID=34691 RepID=A0A182XQR8_ANOQN